MLSSTELSELWTKHSAALLLVAKGHCASVFPGLAEDCVQDAFIKLANQTPAPDSAVAWLMKCVRTTSIDAIRAHQRRTLRETEAAGESANWFESSSLASRDDAAELQQALLQLDRETRDIVIGHLWNEMTFRQLANVIDLSSATIHRRYEQGLQQLKQLMTSSHPTEAESLK
ncbi:MAG: sigma-70 family RNA polymerase sigma factor [Fuerstiella sp.]